MGLETAGFISELVTTNPIAGDDISVGDDHIRLLKVVLDAQFPNFTAAAANPSITEMNLLVGRSGTLRDSVWSAANGGMIDDIQALVDPNVDTLLGWDDSAGAVIGFSPGLGISTLLTSLDLDINSLGTVTMAAGDFLAIHDLSPAGPKKVVPTDLHALLNHDSFVGFVADEHVLHAGVTMTAGVGLAGGGTISATRTFDLDVNALTLATMAAGDFIAIHDVTVTAGPKKAAPTDLHAILNHDSFLGFVADEHILHAGVTLTAGTGMTGGGTISASRTFDVIGGVGITANANDIALDLNELGVETTMAVGDFLSMVDITDSGSQKITLANFALAIDSVLSIPNLGGYVADEHVAHGGVTLTAGNGLSGGGTIAASRTFNLDLNELGLETTMVGADFLSMVDATDSGSQKISLTNFTLAIDSLLLHDNLGGVAANEHLDWTADQGATNIDRDNLQVFGTAVRGDVPASGGGTTNFLRADGTWNNPPGGSASNSFTNHEVVDVDSGFSYTATGTAVATGVTDTLKWVSGVGLNFDVDATLDAIRATVVPGAIDHDALLGFVLDEHVNHTTVTFTAGTGMSGGGTIAANRTFNVDIGSSVQAFGAVLDDLNTLGAPASDGQFIVATAAGVFAYEATSVARTSLGLGGLATLSTISNTNWSGVDLSVTNGGTGASDAATARSNLGLVIGTNVQAEDPVLTDLAALTAVAGADQFIVSTGAGVYAHESASAARTSMGVAIGSNVQAWDPVLDDLAALPAVTGADQFIVSTAAGVYAHESATTARGSMGLGSLATLSSINDGNWSGADLAVVNGGTGASDAGTARSNLGLVIGTNVQAEDPVLTDLAALTTVAAANEFIVSTAAGVYAHENAATARSSMGLGTLATLSAVNNDNWSGTDLAVINGGTGVGTLTNGGVLLGSGTGAITAMAVLADSAMIVSNGSADPVAESGATLRTSIGVREMLAKHKTIDQGYTTTTMTDDTVLFLSLGVGYWEVHLFLQIFSSSSTPDFKFQLVAQDALVATAADTIFHANAIDTSGANSAREANVLGAGMIVLVTASVPGTISIHGTIHVTTAGTLRFQAAQNATSGNATLVRDGSWMTASDLP